MGRITVEEYADFVREDQQRAYRLAYGYLRSREDALDAVQEAFRAEAGRYFAGEAVA